MNFEIYRVIHDYALKKDKLQTQLSWNIFNFCEYPQKYRNNLLNIELNFQLQITAADKFLCISCGDTYVFVLNISTELIPYLMQVKGLTSIFCRCDVKIIVIFQ